MASLTAHLRRPGDHGHLPFHPECPICCRDRLAGPLPSDVVVDGLEVASGGSYDLLNVLVQSNGDLRLIVDDATRVVPVIREREMSRVAT